MKKLLNRTRFAILYKCGMTVAFIQSKIILIK